MKFYTKVKIGIVAIVQFAIISGLNSMICSDGLLQKYALNQLITYQVDLNTVMQKISGSQSPCIYLSHEINDFILRNKFALCRMLTLTKIAQSYQCVSEFSDNKFQIIHTDINPKTLCKDHKLFTASTDGTLHCLDMCTQKNQSIHAQDGAFSCINATSELLITSEINSHTIKIWNIPSLTPCGEITTLIPTSHIEIVNYLIIVLNTAGDIDFYSRNSNQKICTIETGILGIICSVSWNNQAKEMFVTTTHGIYIILLGNIIMSDQLLHNLTLPQIVLVTYFLQNRTASVFDTPELETIFNSLPTMLQDLIKLRK